MLGAGRVGGEEGGGGKAEGERLQRYEEEPTELSVRKVGLLLCHLSVGGFFLNYYYSVNRVQSLNAFLFLPQITQIHVCFNVFFLIII